MSNRPRVPSVEEMRAVLDAGAQATAGAPVPSSVAMAQEEQAKELIRLRAENEALRRDLGALQLEMRQGEKTPKEFRKKLDEVLARHNLDPIEELIRIYTDDTLDVDQKIKILFGIQEYRTPKLKSVEVQGDLEMTVNVNIQRFGPELPLQDRIDAVKRLNGQMDLVRKRALADAEAEIVEEDEDIT